MTNSITTINHLGQTVTQVPGQPGTVTTGRPERVEIDNPVTRDPFAGIPGAYGSAEDRPRPRPRRHPYQVTSDRLADFLDTERGYLVGSERDLVAQVRHLLERLAEQATR
jgi:hypothetical protein